MLLDEARRVRLGGLGLRERRARAEPRAAAMGVPAAEAARRASASRLGSHDDRRRGRARPLAVVPAAVGTPAWLSGARGTARWQTGRCGCSWRCRAASTPRSPRRCSSRTGHEVVGATLKLWGGPSDSGCCSVADVDDARRVADQLGIEHHVFNFTEEFDARVVDPYVAAHARGPDAQPLRRVQPPHQVRRLLGRAPTRLGFDALATGHHARVVAGAPGAAALLRAAPTRRRTSPTCSRCSASAQLARVVLPVGRADQGRGARRAPRARAAHRGQARQPGRLLHPRRQGRRRVPRRAHRAAPGRRSSTRRPASDARRRSTPSSSSPSASAAGSARRATARRRYVVDVDVAARRVVVRRARTAGRRGRARRRAR